MTRIRVEDVSVDFSGVGAPASEAGAIFGSMLLAPENRRYYAELRRRQAQNVAGGVALRHVSVEARAGETLAIVGPSGCGKTTLLRVIAGLQPHDAGRVFFDEQDVTLLSPGERAIGMVFQSYALYPHLKSRDNVSFFYWIHRRQAEIPARVRAVSEMMGLDFQTLLDRKPPKLSGGQQQRVAIARCIAREPRAFLFDEPLSHLDAKLRMQLRAEIKRLLHRFSVTSLYVTHDQSEAIALGDRIGVMRDGRIEQVGTYQEVYATPANAFVAGFIGAPPMNLWRVRIEDGRVQFGGVTLPMPTKLAAELPAGGSALLGVRPEHLELATAGPLEMLVEWVEPRINDHATLLHGTVEGQPAVARVEGNPGVTAGARVRLRFTPAVAHLFSSEL